MGNRFNSDFLQKPVDGRGEPDDEPKSDVLTEAVAVITAAIAAAPPPEVRVTVDAPEAPSVDTDPIVAAIERGMAKFPTLDPKVLAAAIAAALPMPADSAPALAAVTKELAALRKRLAGGFVGGGASGTANDVRLQTVDKELVSDANPLPVTFEGDLLVDGIPDLTGVWDYDAGAVGTLVVGAGKRIVGIMAHTTTGGSIQINGGTVIPLPANFTFNLNPNGQITAPTIVFVGIDLYFVEHLH